MNVPVTFQSHRDVEAKLHDQLYNNIHVLTKIYPTSKDFNDVFKRDMFIKNNKAAFHHVMYYLLHVLSPQMTRQKLQSWPIYDIRQESKFRSEVLVYINELNTIYEHANIPNIMASHLISPGGYKFVKFMLKLSQLVLFEHLKENLDEKLIYPIKPGKNSCFNNITIRSLKSKTKATDQSSFKKLRDFDETISKSITKANEIISEQTKLNQELRKIIAIKEEKKHILEEQKSFPLSACNEKLTELEIQAKSLQEINEMGKQCNELISHLMSKKSVLEFTKEEMRDLPSSTVEIVGSRPETLNLPNLFEGFHQFLEHQNFKLEHFTDAYLNDMANTIKFNEEKYKQLEQRIDINKTELFEALDTIPSRNRTAPVSPIKSKKYEESPLATTLEDISVEMC